MAEFHRYPLRVQQSKLDGWWFIFIDEVPGLGVVGPNYEDLIDRLKVMAGNLFRARGETVAQCSNGRCLAALKTAAYARPPGVPRNHL
jgi:predicted RNase H-like HicB family nuclease